jgi:chaperone LolA
MLMVSLVLLGQSVSAGEDAQKILLNVKQKYDSIKDAELKFLQRTTTSLSAGKQAIIGTLFIKKQNKFRVEVEGQSIITDGDTIWSYIAANKQVVIDKFKKNSRTLTPEKILTAAPTDYSASLIGTEKIGKYSTRVLQLLPKDETSLVTTMKIWVDDSWLIRRADVSDVNGTTMSYFVNDIKVNRNIPDSRFTYQVPKGVEAVDLR